MRKYIRERKYVYTAMALATLVTLSGAGNALAEDSNQPVNLSTSITNTTNLGIQGSQGDVQGEGMMGGKLGSRGGIMRPVVFGLVSAVSGNTITVTNTRGTGINAVTTTYTVDATNAKIIKNNTAGTIASIVVGDTIFAQGTLTNTNLVATTIRDGKINMGLRKGGGKGGVSGTGFSAITGNGQPIVAGTVTTINGSTITITNKSNVTFTIDATNAKITKGPNTVTIGDVTVGDMIIAQGTVNGNAVVAASVIDQAKSASTNNESGTTEQPKPHQSGGFFGGIGAFFAHLFGF